MSETRPAAVAAVIAQDAPERGTRWDFAPGARTGWHRHRHTHAVVSVTECRFLLLESGGLERRVRSAAGAAYARPKGIEHEVVNEGKAVEVLG